MFRHRWNSAALLIGLVSIVSNDRPAVAAGYLANDLFTLSVPAGFNTFNPGGIQPADGGQIVGFGSGSATGFNSHALLWIAATPSSIDMHPAGYDRSTAVSTDGIQQVGNATAPVGKANAMVWSGTAASAVDLNPAGFDFSQAINAADGQQFGLASSDSSGGSPQAFVWSGTAASGVNLNPAGFDFSQANGGGGGLQVGMGAGPTTNGHRHALLWSGTAASMVDLNPAGFSDTQANGLGDGQQVGSGVGPSTGGSNTHALVWSGTAASAVDLNPSGFDFSLAQSVGVGKQIGYGSGPATSSRTHALLWSGTAESSVDLGLLLPASLITSYATSIDAAGRVFGIALDASLHVHAIQWIPIVRGDFDLNGILSDADIPAMEFALADLPFYQSFHNLSDPDFQAIADVNDDGKVDNADTQAELHLLAGGGNGLMVPEPTTFWLAAIGAFAIVVSTRRLRMRAA